MPGFLGKPWMGRSSASVQTWHCTACPGVSGLLGFPDHGGPTW